MRDKKDFIIRPSFCSSADIFACWKITKFISASSVKLCCKFLFSEGNFFLWSFSGEVSSGWYWINLYKMNKRTSCGRNDVVVNIFRIFLKIRSIALVALAVWSANGLRLCAALLVLKFLILDLTIFWIQDYFISKPIPDHCH